MNLTARVSYFFFSEILVSTVVVKREDGGKPTCGASRLEEVSPGRGPVRQLPGQLLRNEPVETPTFHDLHLGRRQILGQDERCKALLRLSAPGGQVAPFVVEKGIFLPLRGYSFIDPR